jgi:hypothetical protein
MNQSLRSMALSGKQLPRALPLVRATWPGVGAQDWLTYVGFLTARTKGEEAGVIALGDPSDYLSGLLVYEAERDLQQGRVLTVPLFTVIDLANSVTPVRALLEAAKAKAADLGCGGLQVRLYPEQAALAMRLRLLGLSDRVGSLWQRLAFLQ